MKIIVITGSTSGIGLGLADAFLNRGCAVNISGHSQLNLDKAYRILAAKYDKSRILVYLCEVSHYDQVQGLWNAARARFGRVMSIPISSITFLVNGRISFRYCHSFGLQHLPVA